MLGLFEGFALCRQEANGSRARMLNMEPGSPLGTIHARLLANSAFGLASRSHLPFSYRTGYMFSSSATGAPPSNCDARTGAEAAGAKVA